MKNVNNRLFFGLFEGLPYGEKSVFNESIADYQRDDIKYDRKKILEYLIGLPVALMCSSEELFGENNFYSGIVDDGKFSFPTDFVRLFREGKVDLPVEYESYLNEKGII